MDKIKIDNEIPQLDVLNTEEIPKIDFKTDGELPLISFDKQSHQAYRIMRMIEEAEQKKQNFRFWLPLIVSNSISVAALLVAILAYIKK